MKKIAIMTWHYYTNFGSKLQAYALQRTIESLGYYPVIINYQNIKFGKVSVKRKIKNFVKLVYGELYNRLKLPYRRLYDPFITFDYHYLYVGHLIQNEANLPSACKGFSTVVCGSDQIWAPNVFNPVYMLNFVPSHVRKVSYAASIGLNEIPNSLLESYRNCLKTFKHISVREKLGAELLKQKCSISAEVVLDPTLLVESNQWEKLEIPIENLEEGQYVFCYFLNADHHYEKLVTDYIHEKNIKAVGWSARKEDDLWMTSLSGQIGPSEFVWLIHHAHSIITDSYHGTIFSLLFHKPFICLERFNDSDIVCQNSRIDQLKLYFDLGGRIVRPKESVKLQISSYDYTRFEDKLRELKSDSINYLKTALNL